MIEPRVASSEREIDDAFGLLARLIGRYFEALNRLVMVGLLALAARELQVGWVDTLARLSAALLAIWLLMPVNKSMTKWDERHSSDHRHKGIIRLITAVVILAAAGAIILGVDAFIDLVPPILR